MATAVARPTSSTSMAPLLGFAAVLALVFAAFSFIQSHRHFNAAIEQYSWLRWASGERGFTDYFRFVVSNTDEVATELAPAAVAGIDSIPLTFAPDAKPAEGATLIAWLNEINPACERSEITLAQCGNAALAARHQRLEQALDAVPLSSDYWIDRKGNNLEFAQLLQLSVQVCGLTPYRTETALLVKPTDGYGKSGVTGWLARAPGECAPVAFGKYRHMPKVFAHSRGADSASIALLQEDTGYISTWQGREVTWGDARRSAERACVGAGIELEPSQCGMLTSPVGFRAVEVKQGKGAADGRWLIADPGLCSPDCAWGSQGEKLPLEALQRHASELATLLPLREAYRAKYGNQRPFIIGVGVEDANGAYRAGIKITDAPALNPLGVASPFRVGDVITEIAGVPIFSIEDVGVALAKFVTTVGADQTYRYQYWRYDSQRGALVKYVGSSTAHFDPAYWLNHGYSGAEVSALMHGFFNAVSFGWYRSIGCAVKRVFAVVPSYTDCKIAAANEWMLIRQLYPDWYSWGAIPTLLFSPIQQLLGVFGVAISASTSFIIELAESGMSAVANRLPGEAIEITAQQFATSVAIGRISAFASPMLSVRY